jgi:hypothetical protein
MQRLFITALACLMSVSVFGQQSKIFYDSNWKLTTDLNSAEYYRIFGDYNYADKTWALKSFYISGEIQWEGNVRNNSPNATTCSKALCNGQAIFYQKNGLKKNLYTYTYGVRDGPHIVFCESGDIQQISHYKNGVLMTKGQLLECDEIPPHENTNDDIRIRVSESLFEISKVAVIGKESTLCDGTIDDGQGISELVEGELLGIYGVVERKHLEEILDEQRLAMSGLLLEDSDFTQAGCLAGAQGTVLASYGCLQGKTKLQVKLVDCSTSDIYWSATGLDVSEFDLLDALRSKLKE